jgi:hypothetical protein
MGSCSSTAKTRTDPKNPKGVIAMESTPIVRLPDHVLLIVHSFLCLQPRTINNDEYFKYFDCKSGGMGYSLECCKQQNLFKN